MKILPKTWQKALVAVLVSGSVVLGCTTQQVDQQAANSTPTLRYQSYPGLVSLPELAEDLGYFGELKLDYVGTVQGGPQDLLTLVSEAKSTSPETKVSKSCGPPWTVPT